MSTVTGRQPPQNPRKDDRLAVVRAVLAAGGGFATIIGGTAAVGDLAALAAVCFVAALTMFTVVYVMRDRRL